MKICLSTNAWDDYRFWQSTDRRMLKRINALIKATAREPFSGSGKPEPLRHALAGYWSRRINLEYRMVYRCADERLLIAQLRHHY